MLGFIFITLLLTASTHGASLADDDNDDPPYHDCPDTGFSYSLDSTFEENLNHTLYTQLPGYSLRTYSNFTNGTGIDQVYALYFCRGDIEVDTCHHCIEAAVQEMVLKCKFRKQGIVWYEFCTLRYANHTITSLGEESPLRLHYNHSSVVSDPVLNPHRQLFNITMNNLITEAAYNGNPLGYATNEANLSLSEKLRGLAQCSPFISSNLCETCLRDAFRQMDQWSITVVFLPSCNIRFDLYGSSPLTAPPTVPGSDPLPERYKVVVGVLLPVIIILLLVGGFWFWRQHRMPSSSEDEITLNATETTEAEPNIEETAMQLTRYTSAQVKEMTSEFQRKIGEGGYAVVYYGRLSDDHREVAVKVFSKNDAPKQFSNEIKVLGRIHHKNLVSLIGYCEEGSSNLALIYEYMSGGDLKALLSERSSAVISWKTRLAIAFDTAQGLDYLHTGCSPFIIHRDVKPANILLNQNLQAKVADFGFSKIFPADFVTELDTSRIIGTPGYVDPQYNSTGQVSIKCDVYSFGVVLLELITGKKAILTNTNTNLVQWVTSPYERGDIRSILDPRLRLEIGESYNTVWRATELAKKCVDFTAARRPTMSDIVIDLRECLALENGDAERLSSATTSTEMMSAAVSTASMSPQPR